MAVFYAHDCIFLAGVCKDLFVTLDQNGFLQSSDYHLLQSRHTQINVPSEVGSISRKLENRLAFVKGAQVLQLSCDHRSVGGTFNAGWMSHSRSYYCAYPPF